MSVWLDIRRPRSEIWKSGTEKINQQAHGLIAPLMKETLGRVVLSCGPRRPENFVCFIDNHALADASISRMLSMVRNELAVYPEIQLLTPQSIVKFFYEKQANHSPENTLFFGFGADARPNGWPLPDFARFLGGKYSYRIWPERDDLIRNTGWLSVVNAQRSVADDQKIKKDTFYFSWGVVAGTPRRAGRVSMRTIGVHHPGSCALFFSEEDRRALQQFVDRDLMGEKILCSVPTIAAVNWLFSSIDRSSELAGKILMTDLNHGWAPSMTLLRFLTDDLAPRRMIMMQELNQLALLEFA